MDPEQHGFELHASSCIKCFSIVKTTLHSPWLVESWIQRNQRYKGPTFSYTWINLCTVQGSTVIHFKKENY